MATSLIAKPQSITPAYNEIKYIYDSTNNNEDGFKYIFDIYDASATKIAEYRVLPDISGYERLTYLGCSNLMYLKTLTHP